MGVDPSRPQQQATGKRRPSNSNRGPIRRARHSRLRPKFSRLADKRENAQNTADFCSLADQTSSKTTRFCDYCYVFLFFSRFYGKIPRQTVSRRTAATTTPPMNLRPGCASYGPPKANCTMESASGSILRAVSAAMRDSTLIPSQS